MEYTILYKSGETKQIEGNYNNDTLIGMKENDDTIDSIITYHQYLAGFKIYNQNKRQWDYHFNV